MTRRAEGKAARRAAILDAALQSFARDGYSGASMEAIAIAAGLSKPTLYSYFASKDALFEAVLQAKLEDMRQALDTPGAQDMVPTLHRFAWVYAETIMRPDMLSLARLMIAEAQRFPQIGAAYQAAGPDRLLHALMDRLTAYRDRGHLRFDAADLAAEDFWGLILSAPRSRALHDPAWHPSTQDLERSITNGLRVFFRAYASDPDAAQHALTGLCGSRRYAARSRPGYGP